MQVIFFRFWRLLSRPPLLIAGTVFLVRWFVGETVIKREDSALEILKNRYARGEINKQEFEERKRDLMS